MKFCKRCGGFFDEDVDTCPDDGAELLVLSHDEDREYDPLIGTVLDGRFHVQSKLGTGGMGSVYRALQASTRRQVALKVILGEVTDAGVLRFMREAHTTSALRNVHTVTIFDFGRAPDGTLYLAMELLDGRPLDTVMADGGSLSWRRAVYVAAQIAESLAEAHDKGIIHRDLKPANVFLTPMGADPDFVKVLDFGIAKLQSEAVTTELTGSGMVLGTPKYMSPEQARGQELDHRSDIYSLGVLLYEMIAGRAPFVSETPMGLLMQHCQDLPPDLEDLRPDLDLPDAVITLVQRLLAKKPEDRYASALEVHRAAIEVLRKVGGMDVTGVTGLVNPDLIDSPSGPTPAVDEPHSPELSLTDLTPNEPYEPRGRVGVLPVVAGVLIMLALGGAGLAVWLVARYTAPGGDSARPKPSATAETPSPPLPETPAVEAPAAERPAASASAGLRGETPAAIAAAPTGASTTSETEQPVAPAPAPAPTVTVTSTPPGARVLSASGRSLGTTPLELEVAGQPQRLKLSKPGYATSSVQVGADSESPVRVRLKRRRPRPTPAPAVPRRMDELLKR